MFITTLTVRVVDKETASFQPGRITIESSKESRDSTFSEDISPISAGEMTTGINGHGFMQRIIY